MKYLLIIPNKQITELDSTIEAITEACKTFAVPSIEVIPSGDGNLHFSLEGKRVGFIQPAAGEVIAFSSVQKAADFTAPYCFALRSTGKEFVVHCLNLEVGGFSEGSYFDKAEDAAEAYRERCQIHSLKP